jgi:hypothetical protein
LGWTRIPTKAEAEQAKQEAALEVLANDPNTSPALKQFRGVRQALVSQLKGAD